MRIKKAESCICDVGMDRLWYDLTDAADLLLAWQTKTKLNPV